MREIRASVYDEIRALDEQLFTTPWLDEGDSGGHLIVYTLSEHNRVLAYALLQRAGDDIELMRIGTAAEYRGGGCAFQLLRYITENLNGRQQFYLEVSEKNSAAIGLYKKCGFSVYAERKKYYRDGSDALLMKYEPQSRW